MELKNVLILHKKSAYRIYFLEKKSSFLIRNRSLIKKELGRFEKAHDEHYATLKTIETVLGDHKIRFTKTCRGQNVNYDKYDLIITVGGDGTFLEAARDVKKSILLGVNSSPSYSVGRFCVANAANFEEVLKRVLRKSFRTKLFQRLRLDIDGHRKTINCLNDILVCNSNPAAMSRYALKIGKIKEEQRCSGVWIASPVGSSGAIRSAGGKIMSHTAKRIQYLPRELYWGGNWKYRLTGGILPAGQSITVISLMRQGRIYIDGAHLEFPFPFGATMKAALSPQPVATINI